MIWVEFVEVSAKSGSAAINDPLGVSLGVWVFGDLPRPGEWVMLPEHPNAYQRITLKVVALEHIPAPIDENEAEGYSYRPSVRVFGRRRRR